MQLGTASAEPGELVRGWFDATGLPTGGDERLPVVIARGTEDGPTLWLTGGVHGDEATGVAVAQDAMRDDLPERLRGTIVSVPIVSPSGLRRNERTTYYGNQDPNRYFPDPERETTRPPSTQERIDRRLYDAFRESADALIDLHTAQIGSVPFSIRDRVLYGEHRTREEAEELSAELGRLVDAFGLPEVIEYEAEEYLDQNLHRSLAGAALNAAGIPAFTAELGGHSVVEPAARRAGVAGIYGVMRELGMIDEIPDEVGEPGEGVPEAPVDYRVRRAVHPRTETAGVLRHRVRAGEAVSEGDAVADVVTPHGEPIATLESEHGGYVLGLAEGLAIYEGEAAASMAVRDEGELVVEREE
jgi:predicted deacylase